MNGDFTDRPLDQWADEEFPGMYEELECHVKNASRDYIPRAFMGTLRKHWWRHLISAHKNLLIKNKEQENTIELLRKKNRNLKKGLKK